MSKTKDSAGLQWVHAPADKRETGPYDPDLPVLVTVAEAARALKVTESTVYRMVRNGEIPAVKVRKVWRVNLTEFVARGDSMGGAR